MNSKTRPTAQVLLNEFNDALAEDDGPAVEREKRGIISKTDARILMKEYMSTDCPKKKQRPICHCQELILFTKSAEQTQDSIRQLYLRAVEEGGHAHGNNCC